MSVLLVLTDATTGVVVFVDAPDELTVGRIADAADEGGMGVYVRRATAPLTDTEAVIRTLANEGTCADLRANG